MRRSNTCIAKDFSKEIPRMKSIFRSTSATSLWTSRFPMERNIKNSFGNLTFSRSEYRDPQADPFRERVPSQLFFACVYNIVRKPFSRGESIEIDERLSEHWKIRPARLNGGIRIQVGTFFQYLAKRVRFRRTLFLRLDPIFPLGMHQTVG